MTEKKSLIEEMLEFIETNNCITLFKGNNGVVYAEYIIGSINGDNDKVLVNEVSSNSFANYLKMLSKNVFGKILYDQQLKVILSYLEAEIFFDTSAKNETLFKRIGKCENAYYYKLTDDSYVEYGGDEGIAIINRPPIKFIHNVSFVNQIEPNFEMDHNEFLELIKKHFNFKTNDDLILFVAWLCYAFIPHTDSNPVHHQMLILTGRQGSGKSTAIEMINKIIAPTSNVFNTINNQEDLITTLNNDYLCAYDNIRKISKKIQDTLCRAVTGGVYTKRMLYSDNETVKVDYKSIVVLNGISASMATNADFLERSIMIQLNEITKGSRRSLSAVWDDFNNDLPSILGGIFLYVNKVVKSYKDIEIDESPRFKDFIQFAVCLSEYLGQDIGFLKIYNKNAEKSKDIVLDSDILLETIIGYLSSNYFNEPKSVRNKNDDMFYILRNNQAPIRNKDKEQNLRFAGTISEFIDEIYLFQHKEQIRLPYDLKANKLSELLTQYEAILNEHGYVMTKTKSNNKRLIKFYLKDNCQDFEGGEEIA